MLLYRLTRLLLVAAYAAATVTAATSPLSSCPTLNPAHQAHSHNAGETDHRHDQNSGPHAGDCLNCCMGTCFLTASLALPLDSATAFAFDGTLVVYAREQSVLTDRPIPPEPAPPKPTS